MSRKVLFVHDGPIYKDGNDNYYSNTMGDKIVDRCLYLGDEVGMLIRVDDLTEDEKDKHSLIESAHVKVFKVPNFKSILKYLKHSNSAKKQIQDAVAKHDLLLVRMPSATGTLAIEQAKKLNKPYLVEYVACTKDAYWDYNWKGKLIAHYKMFQQKKLMRKVPFAIYVTKFFLQNRYPNAGYSTHCSNVEIPDLDQNIYNDRIKSIQNRDSKKIVLGTVAAVDVKYKGQEFVIKALPKIIQNGITPTYFIAGGGSNTRLKEIAKKLGVLDYVVFTGSLKPNEVMDLYKTIDVYIQPSKTEGLPRAVIEAMSIGCPVIGSNTGGLPELVESEMLFEIGNVNQMARLLSDLSEQKLIDLAEKSFQKAKQYERAAIAERRLDFFSKFLAANNLSINSRLFEKISRSNET